MSQLHNDEQALYDKWTKRGKEQARKIQLKEAVDRRNKRDGLKEWISSDVRMILAELGDEEMDLRKYILTLTPSALWELSRHAQKCHTLIILMALKELNDWFNL